MTPLKMVSGSSRDDLLASFKTKRQIIQDRTRSVIDRYHTGFYLYGRPGTSKGWTVKEELGRGDLPWLFHNARLTPMGLFCCLHPVGGEEGVTLPGNGCPLFRVCPRKQYWENKL